MKTTIFSSNRLAGMEENEKTGQLMEKGLLSILTDLYTHALLRSLAPHCSSIVHPHIHKPSYVPCTMKKFSWIIVLVLVLSCSTDQWSICSLLTSIIWSLLFNTWVGDLSWWLSEQYEKRHCIFSPNWCPNELIEAEVSYVPWRRDLFDEGSWCHAILRALQISFNESNPNTNNSECLIQKYSSWIKSNLAMQPVIDQEHQQLTSW